MKTDIHPRFYNATVTCACGHTFQTGATKPQLRVEICSKCHPLLYWRAAYRRHPRPNRKIQPPLQPAVAL